MAVTYTPTTNFSAKDSLPSNDPSKVIKGSEFSVEFTAIQTAFSLAAPVASPTFTGTVTIPTADINGGNIDGTVIGAATPAAGSFTTGQFGTSLNVDGTVTADGLTVDGLIASDSTSNGVRVVKGSAAYYGQLSVDYVSNDVFTYVDSIAGASFNGAIKLRTANNGGSTLDRVLVSSSGVSFYEDTGTTPKFFWDASAESLGIGTASPVGRLDVSGGADGTIGSITLAQGNTTSKIAKIYGTSVNTNEKGIRLNTFHYGDVDAVTITSDGNVGIGETSPLGKLHIKGSDTGATASAQGNSLVLEDSENGLSILSSTAGAGYINFGDSDDNNIGMIVYGHSSNSMNFWTNASERMRIDSSGNVGIGGSPTAFGGGFIVSQTTGSSGGYSLQSSGSVVTQMAADSTASVGYTGTRSNHPHVFTTNNTERMRIDSSGNLLVGTTDTTPGIGDTGAGVSMSAANGLIVSRSGEAPLNLNRNTDDGALILFRRNGAGTTVGSIGARNGKPVFTQDSGDGLRLGGGAMHPVDSSNPDGSDGTYDIGASAFRFKDLYLSGGVYLGGTGAANKLDDYEEGTWTPAFGYSGGNGTGSWSYNILEGNYTKIGRTVYFRVELRFSVFIKGSASGSPLISGLPFTSGGITNGEHYAVNLHTYDTPLPTTAGTFPAPQVGAASTAINLYTIVNDAAYGSMPDPDNNSQYKIAGWYTVA